MLMYTSLHTAKFDFFFPLSICVYLLITFLSHWQSAEPVFYSEELSFLPQKTKTKACLSVRVGKIQILLYVENYIHISVSSIGPPLLIWMAYFEFQFYQESTFHSFRQQMTYYKIFINQGIYCRLQTCCRSWLVHGLRTHEEQISNPLQPYIPIPIPNIKSCKMYSHLPNKRTCLHSTYVAT